MPSFTLRLVKEEDDAALARIFRTVLPEYGACGAGFAIADPEIDFITRAYTRPRHAYFVVCQDGAVKGGAGVGPLEGGPQDVCELRKMYFLPEMRGLGAGRAALQSCLGAAVLMGFTRCYLETLERMRRARLLYEKNGFKPLAKPMGDTGHFGCDRWYIRDLAAA